MSKSVDRIIAAAKLHSRLPPSIEWEDEDGDGSVSIGEWRDVIGQEIKSIETILISIAELSDGRDPKDTRDALWKVIRDL